MNVTVLVFDGGGSGSGSGATEVEEHTLCVAESVFVVIIVGVTSKEGVSHS